MPQVLAERARMIWSYRVTDILNTHWTISDQAIANRVGDEMVVLHLANGTYFGLDPVGALLWEGLASGDRPSQVCEKILEHFEVDRATAEHDLRTFLGELADSELIAQA
jgi:hypothetical protein